MMDQPFQEQPAAEVFDRSKANVIASTIVPGPIALVSQQIPKIPFDRFWWPGVQKGERVSGDGGPGTEYKQYVSLPITVFGRTVHIPIRNRIRVVSNNLPHSYIIEQGRKPIVFVAEYVFEDLGDGTTRYTMYAHVDIQVPMPAKWKARILEELHEFTQKSFNNLAVVIADKPELLTLDLDSLES